jgi:hypothetical protein
MSEKSQAAAERGLRVLERSQLVLRDADGKPNGLTASGLELVERLAARAGTQNFIAGRLGITAGAFKRLLGRTEDENPTRLAWERGRSEHEQDVIRKLLAHGRKNVIALIFYSKAKLGFRENEPPPVADSNIKIVLPRAFTEEEYYKSLGLTGPVKANNIKDITPPRPATADNSKPPLTWASYQSEDSNQ